MKNMLMSLLLVYFSTNAFSQWQWAKQIGGPDFDGGYTVIDENDNLYCYGVFKGPCYFDNDTIYSHGANDIFLAKYDGTGNLVWVKRIGGSNPQGYNEWSGEITIDNNNNCLYFSGQFYGLLNIDSSFVTSIGDLDAFISKFDLDGNCLWIRSIGGNNEDSPGNVNLSNDGYIYWSGKLGSQAVYETDTVSKGTFLGKLGPNGNNLWIRNVMSGGYPTEIKIAGNTIYFCGVTTKDTTVIDTITTISSNYVDCIIGKLDTSGNVFWAKRFGGYSSDYAINLNMDVENNFFVVGQFNDSIIVDADTLSNNGKSDLFFAKFDSIGSLVWIRQSGSDGSLGANAYSIIEDGEGTFYIGGYFNGNAWFGSFNVSSSISTSKDMFIARYDSSGECLGIRHFGEAETFNIQIENSGSLVISGDFSNTVNIGNTILTSHGDIDMFFAKTDTFTGIDEIGERQSNQLLIYANPTQGTCNVTIPDEFKHEKKLTLSIFDNTGKLIQQGTVEMNEEKVRVNLEAEAKGIYNVTLSNGKKSYGGKIVFE